MKNIFAKITTSENATINRGKKRVKQVFSWCNPVRLARSWYQALLEALKWLAGNYEWAENLAGRIEQLQFPVDRLTAGLNKLRKKATSQFYGYKSGFKPKKLSYKTVLVLCTAVITFDVVYTIWGQYMFNTGYQINSTANPLLTEPLPHLGNELSPNLENGAFEYNHGYKPHDGNLGASSKPKYKATFHMDPEQGIEVVDAVNQIGITFKPLFRLFEPEKQDNRLVYPVLGQDAQKVVTLGAAGFKEDIILNEYIEDELSYAYKLVLPDGVEARLEDNGSLGFYGVRSELLGQVSAATPEDEELLNKARLNAEKTQLLFRTPAPYVVEQDRYNISQTAHAWYELEGNVLTLNASNLDEAQYPLSIDPSIYIETAAKLMRGNNETNIDFDVSNELIQKGSTTGARIDDWTSSMALNEDRWNAATTVAGGYVYNVGGVSSDTTTVVYNTAGIDTFDVPADVGQITVKAWGAGGGGGAGGSNGDGGDGGGGGFAQATLSVTSSETLNVYVGEGGQGGTYPGTSGAGGGGGGHSEVNRSGTNLIIAPGGGGGGGGDNSSSTPGGDGGAGGGASGDSGGDSLNANGGGGGTSGSGGAGGTGGQNTGASGGSESGGDGANGGGGGDGTGNENNGGAADGGDGGDADTGGFAGGGGGGGGLYGGGGGSSSQSGNAGGGGGGGGSGYVTGSSTTLTGGSGPLPGNDSDSARSDAGDGGAGGGAFSSGSSGDDGIVVITYSTATDDTISYVRSNGSTGTSTTLDIGTAGTNRLVVVMLDDESSGTNLSNVTVDSNNCNLVTRADNGSGAGNHQEMWYCDEDDLGSSNGSVTISATGGDAGWAIHAHLYTGVSQGGPIDSGIDQTSVGGSTVTVSNINVPANGLVVMGAGNGQSGTWNDGGWTSPLTERTDSPNPSSAVFGTASAVESSAQTDKTYTATASVGDILRGSAIVASWDHGLEGSSGTTVHDSIYWARLSTTNSSVESPNPGAGACTEWCTNDIYDLPDERAGHSLVAYNGFLYVIGGEDSTGTRSDDVFIAKLGANGEPSLWHPTDSNPDNWVYWYQSASYDLSSARNYLAAAAYNNRIYVTGGSTSGSPGGITTVEYAELSPTGLFSSWSSTGMSALPSARFGHSVETYNDRLYVIGGNSSGSQLNTVHYTRLAVDGTMGSWQATENFSTGRSTWGGDFSTIWGGYIYIGGGCSAVNGSGYCTAIENDVQLASINADGSLGPWNSILNLSNERIGYGFVSWRNALYRVGGCSNMDTANGDCTTSLATVDYGVINQDGDASTVSISQPSGSGDCTGGSPINCDLPPGGDDAGEIGHMLSAVAIVNGYLYVVGGCVDYDCNGTTPEGTDVSGNVAYVAINSDGTLGEPASCPGSTYGAWCIDSSNRVNGTTGTAASGVAVFGGHIYLVGGLTGGGNHGSLFYNTVNLDGSLAGAWTEQTLASVGISESISYTYAYARANPNSAGTNPGNLFVFGGCGGTSGAGCTGSDYETEVYKCNIQTSGAVAGCTTSGQLQLDTESGTGGAQGLGIHSGTVYANYVYLVGGYSQNVADRDTIFYAEINDSNNIVAVSGGEWVLNSTTLNTGRRRGSAFGYNGYIYAVGGFDNTGGTIIDDIEFAKVDVSDGSIGEFSTSAVTINQRWGLALAVSNSYAYVIGGCDIGVSPGGCSSFEVAVQTFQVYNNDSGAPAAWGAGSNLFGTDRLGASAAVVDGYIYLAGGCTSTAVNCETVTDNVQYASLDQYGDIGTWSSTTSPLPDDRAWGQLEEAGGSLYYVGGSDDMQCDPTGDAFYEKYDSISGTAITDLYNDADWPGNPSSTQTLSTGELASAVNIDDNFGARLSALICPPQDGDYTFYVSGDDGTELRLSTDTDPGNVSVIAEVPGWSGVEEWDKYTEQTSSAVTLEAGKYYYIEANYKEGSGGDHVEIGWTLPDATDELPIPDTRYSLPSETDALIDNPVSTVYYATPGGSGDISSWSTASNGLPEARSQFSSDVWNDRIYVVSGVDDTAAETNDVYISPQLSSGGNITSAWTTESTNLPEVARSGHTTLAYANNLYLLGGYDGSNYLSDVQFTQINTDGSIDAWTYTESLPGPIRQGDGFVRNGYMYLFGGRSSDTNCQTNTFVAPISANTTIATGNNPTGIGAWYETNEKYSGDRYGSSAVFHDGKAYVLGGACASVGPESEVWEDDFDPSIDGADWTATTGMSAATFCASTSGNALHSSGGTDVADTTDEDVSYGGTIYFDLFIAPIDSGSCNAAEAGEDVILQYSTNSGGAWTTIATYDEASFGTMTSVSESIPAGAQTSSTRFRWTQVTNSGEGFDHWVIDDVSIDAAAAPGDPVLTGANRVVQTTLLSQPQVAKYSRMIDTDTDVFPNRWLLNGVDNSIGAFWDTRYQSSTAATAAWGQETDFGEVTLGSVETFTPLDGSGTNTNFARYYYFWIEIDASRTFGYPEDVERGPTITDLTLFFTSDPSKRLRHGKTFTGGEKQPLDTPPGP